MPKQAGTQVAELSKGVGKICVLGKMHFNFQSVVSTHLIAVCGGGGGCFKGQKQTLQFLALFTCFYNLYGLIHSCLCIPSHSILPPPPTVPTESGNSLCILCFCRDFLYSFQAGWFYIVPFSFLFFLKFVLCDNFSSDTTPKVICQKNSGRQWEKTWVQRQKTCVVYKIQWRTKYFCYEKI